MNIKRFMIASIALFIFIFIYEFVVHGMLLTNLYLDTPNLWRSKDEMMAYIPFNIAIEAIIAIWLTFIFTRFYKTGGKKNGLHFGFYLGILSGIQAAGAYFYLPISVTLATSWFIAYLIESIIGGLLIGSIYQN